MSKTARVVTYVRAKRAVVVSEKQIREDLISQSDEVVVSSKNCVETKSKTQKTKRVNFLKPCN